MKKESPISVAANETTEQTEKKEPVKTGRKLTKKQKILITVLSAVFTAVVGLTIGLCLHFFVYSKTDYFQYYNNFNSAEVKQAECTLNLPKGTYISSFNPTENVFITAAKYLKEDGDSVELFGLASADKEFCKPYYGQIIQIKGDYAIVARPPKTNESSTSYYIDVIRFKGADNTPYSLLSSKSIMYQESFRQLRFVGDSIVVYGELDAVSSMPSYATFYDYTTGAELLEKFKIRTAYDSNAQCLYEFIMFDGFIAAYSTDRAYFYSTSYAPQRGYLETAKNGEYTVFSELTQSALSDYTRELQVYYIGNGWFLRSAMIYIHNKPWNGFNVRLESVSGKLTKYAKTKVDFYNIKSGVTREFGELAWGVAGVANEYTKTYYSQQSYSLGAIKNYDEKINGYPYDLPYGDPSGMIKNGYSIVYFYYLPYLDLYKEDNKYFLGYTGETTYSIFDKQLNRKQPDNALMPTSYIDGVGVQNSDPSYSEISGDAYAFDRYMNRTTLIPFVNGGATYVPHYGNQTACIVQGTIKNAAGETVKKYAAYTPDGNKITDFIYDELTYYSGGYALGRRTDETDKKSKVFRIDKFGKEEEILDAEMIFQGSYTYKDGEKIGIKNYKGEVVIEAGEYSISVCDKAMDGKKAMSSYAVLVADDYTKIYVLQ